VALGDDQDLDLLTDEESDLDEFSTEVKYCTIQLNDGKRNRAVLTAWARAVALILRAFVTDDRVRLVSNSKTEAFLTKKDSRSNLGQRLQISFPRDEQ
jgi:hypothetical protein